MKVLRKCKCGKEATTEEELELFAKAPNCNYGRRNKCKECVAKQVRKAKGYTEPKKCAPKGTYTTVAGQSIWLRYGLSEEAHKKFVEKAQGRCEICKTTENLVVDHCHTTNTLRGTLCKSCNTAIAPIENSDMSFDEILNRLKRMAEYVENHKLISHTLPTISELKKQHIEKSKN